jgi:hypothetical protein
MNARNLAAWLVALLVILALPASVRPGVELERAAAHGADVAGVAGPSMREAPEASLTGGGEPTPPSPGSSLPCEHDASSCGAEQSGGESLEEHGAGIEVVHLGGVMPVDPFFDFGSHVLSMAYFPALLRPPIA